PGLVRAERLAAPAFLVLDQAHALALLRPRDDQGRRVRGPRRFEVRAVDRLEVVAVDLARLPPERAGAPRVRRAVPAERRVAAVPEAVHGGDRDDGSQGLLLRGIRPLP